MSDRLTSLTLQHALRLAAQNEHRRALEILGALEVTLVEPPSELKATRTFIEQQLLELLRRQFPDPNTCLVPTCDAAELRHKAIRAKDAYVWTQCDGMTTLNDLLALAENQLDTLLSLSKLVALGLLLKPAKA